MVLIYYDLVRLRDASIGLIEAVDCTVSASAIFAGLTVPDLECMHGIAMSNILGFNLAVATLYVQPEKQADTTTQESSAVRDAKPASWIVNVPRAQADCARQPGFEYLPRLRRYIVADRQCN